MTVLVVTVLALVAFGYVALPLVSRRHTDPLPDETDPVLAGLEEEKAALLRAITELDVRQDLTAQRRDDLRLRYEAKAAAAIKAIEGRKAKLQGSGAADRLDAPRPMKRRAPVAALGLLAVMVAAAALLPTYVLPRVGQDSNVTTTDVDAARRIRELRAQVDREPSPQTLLELGDTYLAVGELEDAVAAYERAAGMDGAPATVFQRLAVVALQSDLTEAQGWLARAAEADPTDTEALFLLSEVAYANGDLPASEAALRSFVELSDAPPSDAVAARLELFDTVEELTAAAQADPTEQNLLALGDLYWRAGDRRGAASAYLRALTETGSTSPVALGRMGQAMLESGAPSDAAALLERAAQVAGGTTELEGPAQLALGEAYLQSGRNDDATRVLAAYQDAGGSDPVADELLALAGGDLGAQVFSSQCAQCHGPAGGGGMGVALAGNPRARDEANVRDAVTFGRGMMPGFGATLSGEELEAVIAHVVEDLFPR